MSDRSGEKSSGISFLDALALIFITLRLCGVIDWPWWVVLSPIWAFIAVALVVLAVAALADRL